MQNLQLSTLTGLNEKFDRVFEKASGLYRNHEKKILKVLTAILMFFLTYRLLTLIPFFPYRWVVFLSACSALSALKSKSLSFTITWFAVAVSLAYQNSLVGGIAFLIYAIASPAVFSCSYLEFLIYASSFYLMFYNLEFFPIVLASLIYGAKKAVKVSLVTFFSGFAMCILLPISTLGHLTLDFNVSLISKPPAGVVSISEIAGSIANMGNAGKFGAVISRVISGVANSQQFIVLLVGWVLIAVIPGYVKDAVRKYGHMVTLIALLASSYVPFFAVSFIYPAIPGFSTNASNVLSFAFTVAIAWVISEIVSSERSEGTERSAIQYALVDDIVSSDSAADTGSDSAASANPSRSGSVSEQSRINALMRELETKSEEKSGEKSGGEGKGKGEEKGDGAGSGER